MTAWTELMRDFMMRHELCMLAKSQPHLTALNSAVGYFEGTGDQDVASCDWGGSVSRVKCCMSADESGKPQPH